MIDINILDDKYCSLKESELLILASDFYCISSIWLFEFIIIGALKNNKKVLCLLSDTSKEDLILKFKEDFKINNLDNLTILQPDDAPYMFTVSNIQPLLEKDNDYDLVIVDKMFEFEEFEECSNFEMSSIISNVKKGVERFQIPFVTLWSIGVTQTSKERTFIKNRFIENANNNVDYIVFVEDNNLISDNREKLSEINVEIFNNNEISNYNYLIDTESCLLYKNEDKLNELYNFALTLGIDNKAALEYAAYWDKEE